MAVDDENDILLVLEKGLKKYGFDVNTFSDPAAALSKFKPNNYCLILTDIRMPKMNGFDLHEGIRKIDGKAKVCFLTVFETAVEKFNKVSPELDVQCMIRKTIELQDLVKKINTG